MDQHAYTIHTQQEQYCMAMIDMIWPDKSFSYQNNEKQNVDFFTKLLQFGAPRSF